MPNNHYHHLVFGDDALDRQRRNGSYVAYGRQLERGDDGPQALTDRELLMITRADQFCLATVTPQGWPYLQYRSGPAGFVQHDPATGRLGFIDVPGNNQFVTLGNLADDDRLAMFFVDYPRRVINPRSVLEGRDILRVEAFGRALVPPRSREDARHPRIGFIRIEGRPADRSERDAMIESWLAEDDRPVVYVGFGSMPVVDFDGVVGGLAEILGPNGLRVLAVPGWSARTRDEVVHTADLLIVPDVDHDTVFPRCAALVHHGGAGTTAIAAASGRPSLVCSQAFDQHFWGRRIEAVEAGAILPRRRMTARTIAEGVLRLVRDQRVVDGARRTGAIAAADLGGRDEFLAAFDAFLAEVDGAGTAAPGR